jgi:hypothetical protein
MAKQRCNVFPLLFSGFQFQKQLSFEVNVADMSGQLRQKVLLWFQRGRVAPMPEAENKVMLSHKRDSVEKPNQRLNSSGAVATEGTEEASLVDHSLES